MPDMYSGIGRALRLNFRDKEAEAENRRRNSWAETAQREEMRRTEDSEFNRKALGQQMDWQGKDRKTRAEDRALGKKYTAEDRATRAEDRKLGLEDRETTKEINSIKLTQLKKLAENQNAMESAKTLYNEGLFDMLDGINQGGNPVEIEARFNKTGEKRISNLQKNPDGSVQYVKKDGTLKVLNPQEINRLYELRDAYDLTNSKISGLGMKSSMAMSKERQRLADSLFKAQDDYRKVSSAKGLSKPSPEAISAARTRIEIAQRELDNFSRQYPQDGATKQTQVQNASNPNADKWVNQFGRK